VSLLKPPGATRLSQLEIDVDKDWAGMGISNLLELVATMQKGDMLVRSDGAIVKITPAGAGTRFTTQGLGELPTWSA